MKNSDGVYTGIIDSLPKTKVYLNIDHLDTGIYQLLISHKHRIIKVVSFKKE
ncbi:hypothetical protein ABN763_14235 [Spongiivirga sp. MCCC 1A20706]|uniref:hypothetical protein n=1 Tax=Spongiivirga sp. MCCC 1A20706 TaxID=3160963 RepID=UPI00397753B6